MAPAASHSAVEASLQTIQGQAVSLDISFRSDTVVALAKACATAR